MKFVVYRDMIYTISGKDYFKFQFSNQDIYISIDLKGQDKDFHPIDINGNEFRRYSCNFNKSGTCTIKEPGYYSREEKKTPKVQFKKGTKKSQVNARLIEALETEVDSKLYSFKKALNAVNKLTKITKHAKRHFWLNDVCTCHGLLPSHSA